MKNRKIIAILILSISLGVVLLCATMSASRYVFDEEKHILGTYTDFVISHNGNGQTVIMQKDGESGGYTGYIAINVNNFTAEKISKRDIIFNIEEPTDAEINAGKVVGSWGREFPIEPKSINYDVEIVNDRGESYFNYKADGTKELKEELKAEYEALTHLEKEKQNTSAVLLKITRKTGINDLGQDTTEPISIILRTSRPYRDLQVFTINASKALISMGVADDTYHGYSERTVNVKTSTDFVWKEAGSTGEIFIGNDYLAVITLTLSDNSDPSAAQTGEVQNVILDEYRFHEVYDAELVKSADGNVYTLTLKPGADIFLHFYVLGNCSVTATAKLDYKQAGVSDDVVISGTGSNGLVFAIS